jgi:ZIP family zinc transporter
MLEALGWGAVAASSLLIGALFGLVRPWPSLLVGLVLGFGAGALISAVSFELAQDGVKIGGGAAVGIGLAAGALTYYVCDGAIERRAGDSDAGAALALGAFLDGIPEQLVLGLGIALGDGVSAGLLAAIFVSNLPESIGSSTAMRAAGRSRGQIATLWAGVAVTCTLASVIGFAIADSASHRLQGGINGFAAGALVVMLVDSMIPDATRQAGRRTGLVTTLGFAVAAALSGIGA